MKRYASLLNSRELRFCLSAVGFLGFSAFERSRAALGEPKEGAELQGELEKTVLVEAPPSTCGPTDWRRHRRLTGIESEREFAE
jgi:hypothetical protein